MKQIICQLFKDKNGHYSLREISIALLLVCLVVSWVGMQFFGKPVPEFMFFSFSSLIAAGCFGYSLERRTALPEKEPAQTDTPIS